MYNSEQYSLEDISAKNDTFFEQYTVNRNLLERIKFGNLWFNALTNPYNYVTLFYELNLKDSQMARK